MIFDGTFSISQRFPANEDGSTDKPEESFLVYNFGLAKGAVKSIPVNRPMAEYLADCGSKTAQAALRAADLNLKR